MNYRIITILTATLVVAMTLWATEQLMSTQPTAHARADFSCANVSEIPLAECEALVALTTTNPQLSTEGWLTTDTPCSWTGITCSTGTVTQLALPNLGVQTIPPEIGNLPSLLSLDLSNNALSTLPIELNNLSRLTSVDLSGNGLTTAPDIQPEMTGNDTFVWNLALLDLRNNQLAELPSGIREAYDSGFIILELEGNSVPPEVLLGYEEGYYDCTTVNEPSQAECDALKAIYVANIFPFLDLNGWISGTDPCAWDGVTCANGHVTELRLSNEGLQRIPNEIEALTFLEYLDLSDNDLTSLPPALNRLSALETLNISGNPLTPTALALQDEPQLDAAVISSSMIFLPLMVE